MIKHVFWGFVVLILGFLAAYVGLTVSGHPEQAEAVGTGGVIFFVGSCVLAYFYMLLV